MFQTDELSCIKVPRDEGSSIDVTLRCDLGITGSVRLKAIGFIKPDESLAQLVVMHIGCASCEHGLEMLCA